jgi:hypothetical protein
LLPGRDGERRQFLLRKSKKFYPYQLNIDSVDLKGGTKMSYTKPELVSLTSALSAIQGVNKGCLIVLDVPQNTVNMSAGAYEADE